MESRPSKARLFVAMELPGDAREALAEWRERALGGREELRLVAPDALADAGLYTPEKRPFWPHVTLARVRKGARVRGIEMPEPPSEPWRGAAVTLYRSRLSREGARYDALETVLLP